MADPEILPNLEDSPIQVGTSFVESGLNLEQDSANIPSDPESKVNVPDSQDGSRPTTPDPVNKTGKMPSETRISSKKDDPIMKSLSPELQQGYRILRELMSDNNKAFNWAFMNAVDDSHSDTSDYYDIVDNPMWLKRMKEKFVDGLYENITQFVTDFRVMLENCYRYNGPDHFISKRGQRLEMMLEQKLALLSRELREKTSVTATSGGKVEESFSSAMRRRVKSTYQRDTSALLSQLRQEEAQRDKESRRQQILDRKAANEALIQEQIEWENTLLQEPIKSQMYHLWELPQIGHFLFLCQDPLNVGEIAQFELERGFAMPRQSSCIQAVMSTLLSTPHQRTKLGNTGVMPYAAWHNLLHGRLTQWYKCLSDNGGDAYKTSAKLGIDSFFFDVIGKKNPLDKRKFHELSYYRRIWIVKSLCDNCLETQESLRDAIERQPLPEQHEYLIGYDTKGNSYIHFPQFCGADLRIYKQEPFPEPDFSEEEENLNNIKVCLMLDGVLGECKEEIPPSPKKSKLETPSKKSTPVNSRQSSRNQTPESANLRRSRRGQSEESCNSNNNSSVKSSASKRNLSNFDDTSNDSTSFPVSFLGHRARATRASCRTPLFLDETSNDSTTPSMTNSRKKRTNGRRKRSRRLVETVNDNDSVTESDFMDESTCSSLTECAIDDRLSEDRESIKSGAEKISPDSSLNDSQISKSQNAQNSAPTKDNDSSQSATDCVHQIVPDSNLVNTENKDTLDHSKQDPTVDRSSGQTDTSKSPSSDIDKHNIPNNAEKVNNDLDNSQREVSPAVKDMMQKKAVSDNVGLDNCKTMESQSSSYTSCDMNENHNKDLSLETVSRNSKSQTETRMEDVKFSLGSMVPAETSKSQKSLQSEGLETGVNNEDHLSQDPVQEIGQAEQKDKGHITQCIGEEKTAEVKTDTKSEADPAQKLTSELKSEVKIEREDQQPEISSLKEEVCQESFRNEVQLTDTYQKPEVISEVKKEPKDFKEEFKMESDTEMKLDQQDVKKEPKDIQEEFKIENNSEVRGDQQGVKKEPDYIKEEFKMETDAEVKKENDIKKEEEIEEESEEELEPELGSFKMICDNVDDLRKLVDKFAEQEPIVIKRGNKEKVVQPAARKKCIVELHERLAFLLSELEPWESKLNAAMRKARVKIRKEFEEYEEVVAEKWEESESRTNTDVSENEENEAEESPAKRSDQKSKTGELDIKEEPTDIADDDIEYSSRGRLRKRRVIPNNSEESLLKKKKVIKKEEPAITTHVPNILHRQTPVTIGEQVASQSLTIQSTSLGHTIAIRPSLTNQPQSASQLLRLSVANQKMDANYSNMRQQAPVSLVKQSSHPVIQQLLAKQSIQPQSLVNTSKQLNQKVAPNTSQPSKIHYVITNQPQATPATPQGKPQVTSLSALPAGLLQQLIKNQAVKIQKNIKGETQLVLAAPLQISNAKKPDSQSTQGPLVITPTVASLTPVVSTVSPQKPFVVQTQNVLQMASLGQVTLATTMPCLSVQNQITPPSLSPNMPQTVISLTSPSKPVGPKYATNVTVKTLLENRAALKSDATGPGTETSTNVITTVHSTACTVSSVDPLEAAPQSNTEITGARKVIAKLLQVPVELPESITSSPSSISTSLPTVNIKVPPPVTLPLIQPRKNITKTVQMINAPIPVTTKSKTHLDSAVLSSNMTTLKPFTNLTSASTGQAGVFTKPGTVLQNKTPETNTILLQGQNKGVVPQNLAAGSPNFIQGILTPQGLQIPSNLLSNSGGSFILQMPKSTTATVGSSLNVNNVTQPANLQRFASVQMATRPTTTTTVTAVGNQVGIRQPASYFILQQPTQEGQKVQLQKVQNQPVLGTGPAVTLSQPALTPGSTAVQLKTLQGQPVAVSKPTNFIISQNVNQGNAATMQASNLVRQLADQQKLQVPVGQKAVGLQVIGQPGTAQLPQNFVGLQGILPSGQVVQLQTKPGNVAVQQGSQVNVPNVQTVQLQGALLKSPNQHGVQQNSTVTSVASPINKATGQYLPQGKSPAQANPVLMTQNTPNHVVRLQTVSQQILQQLQVSPGQRQVRPVIQTPNASSQLQFHLNVAGNKVGLSPATRFVTKPPAVTSSSPSSSKLPVSIHMPLSVTIPNSGVGQLTPSQRHQIQTITHPASTNIISPRFVTPVKGITANPGMIQNPASSQTASGSINKSIPVVSNSKTFVSLNTAPEVSTSVTQSAVESINTIVSATPTKIVENDPKPHVIWPSEKTDHKRMNVGTKILQLTESDLSPQATDASKSITTQGLDVTSIGPCEKINLESPEKQKLLLYNIGGQLMTAQGIPVTVDHGVLKIVPQATIQIGNQTLTVRAPGQSSDPSQIPVTMSGKTTFASLLSQQSGANTGEQAVPTGVTPTSTTPSTDDQPVSASVSKGTLATFPYSFSSQAMITSPAIPLSTQLPPSIYRMNQEMSAKDEGGNSSIASSSLHDTKPKLEIKYESAVDYQTDASRGGSDVNISNVHVLKSVDSGVASDIKKTQPVIEQTVDNHSGAINITENQVSNGTDSVANKVEQGTLNTVQSPEKEAAKNLLALANQALLSMQPR
ncbi:hypothetical protein LOTGIDRAFT_152942 [Lottia gigantea]|uniref:Bromo domain-containing protein n=1 Tax=Lottia gigantea TaxID=225164 RepID=V4C819_LOTGI|nr:hypothetical protein LOTGIDRAFT_152942 [Lottia gigantea]ESO97839.1 hypothetical protein LOTGIDRAFT_152942 [Lottia gigantea]